LVVGGTQGLGYEISQSLRIGGIIPIEAGRSFQTQLQHVPHQLQIDLSDFDSMDRAIADLTAEAFISEIDYVFMVAGVGLKGSFLEQTDAERDRLVDVNLRGPLHFRPRLINARLASCASPSPIHWVEIASTSALKTRPDEMVYGGTKAGQAQTVRNLGKELPAVLPGSKVTLVIPGGLKGTRFYDNTPGVDTSGFMDPALVADRIVYDVLNQQNSWDEIHIERDDQGQPKVSYGVRPPVV
jgi:NADP-dependent 3-hydroxy acid dehydrogenase YdfG